MKAKTKRSVHKACRTNKTQKTNAVMSAVYMPSYGIATVVMTQHEKIERYLKEYVEEGMHLWPELKKRALYSQLKMHLLQEDAYFNLHTDDATRSNIRWADFCDGCIELATLDLFFFGNPIALVHPDSFGNQTASNPVEAALVSTPTLVDGIKSMRCDH